MDEANTILLLVGLVFVIGQLGEVIFKKTGIPDVLILLLIGIVVGPILGILDSKSLMAMAPFAAPIAIMIILFESGLAMNIYKVIGRSPRAILLASLNLVVSVILVALATNFALGWDYIYGALLGAILGGTSSVTVITMLKQIKPCEEVEDLLVLECTLNDAITIVATLTILGIIASNGNVGIEGVSRALFSVFAVGAVMGVICAVIWLYIVFKLRMRAPSPVMAITSLFIMYPITEMVGGNGAVACLLFGIVIANGSTLASAFRMGKIWTDLSSIRLFQTELSFFVRTFFFVYLGAMASLNDKYLLLLGGLIAVILMGARSFCAFFSTLKSKLSKERELISSLGPRGLAAAVASQLPLAYGMAYGADYVELTLSSIIWTTIISSILIWWWKQKRSACSKTKKMQGERKK